MKYGLADGVTVEDVGGTLVLMDKNDNAAVLNESASAILNALLNGTEEEEAASIIAGTYDVDIEEALADVKDVVSQLVVRQLIERAEEVSNVG